MENRENSTAWAVMPNFAGFVNYWFSSSDPKHQNWKKLEITAIPITVHERIITIILWWIKKCYLKYKNGFLELTTHKIRIIEGFQP